MTDAEWSARVDKNVQEWTADERDKQQRLKDQRDEMKIELEIQMEQKVQRNRYSNQTEKIKDKEYLAAVDRKLIDEEMKTIQHNHNLNVTVSAGKQYALTNLVRKEKERSERQMQFEERRHLDEQINAANMADMKVQGEKRY